MPALSSFRPSLVVTVKQFIDFIPLLLFLIAYVTPLKVDILSYHLALGDIFGATAVLVGSSIVVYGVIFVIQRRLDKGQWITLIGCLIFGGLTLALHNENFVKWKAPVVNWVFAIAFLGSHFIGSKPLVRRIMDHAISLPDQVWMRLNVAWIIFFIVCGAANLFVAFTFDSIWVYFKVFGSLVMTLIFIIAQGVYLARHIQETPESPSEK